MTLPSKHFQAYEMVPPAIHQVYGDRSWQFVDERLMHLLDFIREHFNKPVTINSWHEKGQYKESGFRLPDTTTGGKLSQHKHGRAADIKVEGMTPQQVYKEILDNEKLFMDHGLTTMEDIEDTPTWVHVDIRYQNGAEHIVIVNPIK